MVNWDGVKIFSVTSIQDRCLLGERITEWLQSSGVELVDKVVVQSSDSCYHCVSIVLFFKRIVR